VRAGELERAEQELERLHERASGPGGRAEIARGARITLAEVCLESGRVDEADARLRELSRGVRVDALEGEAWTPISETLYETYSYFMSRGSNRPLGQDSSTKFDVYDELLDGSTAGSSSSYLADPMYDPGSGVYLNCRKNFVIVLTDGEPTRDDFDNMDLSRFKDLIGD